MRRGPLIAAAVAGSVLVLVLATYLLAPRISVAGFDIEQTPDTHFTFSLKLEVQNRLPIDVRVDAYEFFLDINDQEIGHTHHTDPTEIPAWETTHVTIEISGYERDLPEWLQMGRHMAPVKREYDYHFHGWIKLGRPFAFKYDFDTTGTLPGFSMPDILYDRLRVAKMDLFNPEMEIDLKIVNPNGFEIIQRNFMADVIIQGVPVGRVDAKRDITYKAHGEQVESFRFRMQSIRGGAAAMQFLFGGSDTVMLRLKGQLDVETDWLGTFPFEFDKEGPAPIQPMDLLGGRRRR